MPETAQGLPRVEHVNALLEEGRRAELEGLLAEIHPADIAELLDHLPPENAQAVFDLLPVPKASEVLDETGSLVRRSIVEKLDDRRLAELLSELPMDDAARFLSDLEDEDALRLVSLMHPQSAREVRKLLSYGESTAGRLMSTDVAVLRKEWSAAQAVEFLRSLDDDAETLHYLYVVDEEHRLIGVVPIRNLLLAKAGATIGSIMIGDVVAVPVTADQEDLAEFISRYDFVAIPVVDERGRLAGVVTVDDALDVIEEEATEDIQRLGGSEPLDHPYFGVSVLRLAMKRIVWLLPLFGASVITDAVLNSFSGLLAAVVSLTVFIPVVIGTAGNAASQTVATIIRALAVGQVRLSDLGRAWKKEATVALLLGVLLGAAGYVRAVLMGADPAVGIVLAATLPLVILWANSIATLIPLVAERMGIDPTVVSAPMITTLVDATGILIYLVLARMVLGM